MKDVTGVAPVTWLIFLVSKNICLFLFAWLVFVTPPWLDVLVMVKRSKTPSFITEFPLKVTAAQEKRLSARFEAARYCYNACLGEAERRRRLLVDSRAYQQARKMPRKTAKERKVRSQAFKTAKAKVGYDEFALHAWAKHVGHSWIGDHVDSLTVQALATRAYKASEKVSFGKARKVRFKGKNQVGSIEGKNNKSGIRWKGDSTPDDRYRVEWTKLTLTPVVESDDEVVAHGLGSRVKFVRLVRRKIRGKIRWYCQLVCEGLPYVKEENRPGKGTVGLDLGPSTVAYVAVDSGTAGLELFCDALEERQNKIRLLQRKDDRQRRSNNPNSYDDKGRAVKGKRPSVKSRRQRITEAKISEEQRRQAAHRKSLHGQLANQIIPLGDTFKIEKISYQWFQKNFGRSVGKRAPGMFVEMLRRKAASADGATLYEFGTRTTKLSQTCLCGRVKKKKLSKRWHSCECGVSAQRDLFSAYLACFVETTADNKDVLETDQALVAWSGSDPALQSAYSTAIQTATANNHIVSSFGSYPEVRAVRLQSDKPRTNTSDDVPSNWESAGKVLETTGRTPRL